MAVTVNISFHRGEDVVITFTAVTVTDITGWTIKFSLYKQTGSTATHFTKQTGGSGVTLTVPASGTFTVTILKADTNSLAVGNYHYDVRRIDSGSETVLTEGTLTLKP